MWQKKKALYTTCKFIFGLWLIVIKIINCCPSLQKTKQQQRKPYKPAHWVIVPHLRAWARCTAMWVLSTNCIWLYRPTCNLPRCDANQFVNCLLFSKAQRLAQHHSYSSRFVASLFSCHPASILLSLLHTIICFQQSIHKKKAFHLYSVFPLSPCAALTLLPIAAFFSLFNCTMAAHF